MPRILYGFLGDLDVLLEGRSCCLGASVDGFFGERNLVGVVGNVSRSVNSGTSYSDVIVKLGSVDRGINGRTGDTDFFSEDGGLDRGINGCTGDTDLFFVDGGLDTSAIFLLDAVNGRVVRLVFAVKLDGRLRVG